MLSLPGLLAIYLAFSIASSLAVRPGCGPDEPAHFIYVREIGGHFRMPVLAHQFTSDIDGPASHEALQPPLYYALTAVPYAAAAKLGLDTDTIWRILRIFTCLLGAVWVYLLYKMSMEFFGGRQYPALLAAACVGLLPLSTYIGGVVNNDILVTLLSTAALRLMLGSVRREELSRRDALGIGVICGLAVLSKAQGIFLLPTVIAAGLMIARGQARKSRAGTIVNTTVAVLIAALVCSPWFIRNWVAYGSPNIQSLYQPGWGWSYMTVSIVTDQLFKYFWTPFWIVGGYVNKMAYTRLLLAFCFIVFVGVTAHLRATRSSLKSDLSDRLDAWALLVLPGALIYVFLLKQTLTVDRGLLQQGRLLLPAAGLLGVAVPTAIRTLIRQPRLRIAAGWLLILGLIAGNILVIQAIIDFYA